MQIDGVVNELIEYAIRCGLTDERDRAYSLNLILDALSLTEYRGETSAPRAVGECRQLCDILGDITDYAYEAGIIESDSVAYRDLFDTKIMGMLTPRPSEVISKFESLYVNSPLLATDYFYKLACDSNYIRTDRIAKDLKWKYPSEYGEIDITVNLSKPEKDPRAIAAAKLLPQADYPKCLLCHENEGFAGNPAKPARQTLRQIPFDMAGKRWYIQYSPYVYYNEHCIALSGEHTPMKIDRGTFDKLLGFVDHFPHYFIGSNADLPIVGGSILAHDHMQGGRYSFAMERAAEETKIVFDGFEDVYACILKWPMSVIRIRSENLERLAELADKILTVWRTYTDPDAFIYSETEGQMHNTITPIARRRGELYELDLVLRNNITTDEHPLGVYHPHAEYHNIKKENIGLIEVMGLAVLPSRLKHEIELMRDAVINGKDFDSVPGIQKHKAWFSRFMSEYEFTPENTEDIIKSEIGKTFVGVLRDAGVYKDTPEGREAFARFIAAVGGVCEI